MELWQAAKKYEGVRWQHRGRSDSALDCIGLLVRAIQDCGGEVEDRINYGREPVNDGLEEELETQCTRRTRSPRVNDIVLMRYRINGPPAHVGIVTPWPGGGLGLIHALGRGPGKVIHTRYGKRDRRLTAGVFEWVQPDR